MIFEQIRQQERASNLARVPAQWRRRVESKHAERLAWADNLPVNEYSIAARMRAVDMADEWLRGIVERIDGLRVPVGLSESDLVEMADRQARTCMDMAGDCFLKTPGAIRGRLARHVEGYGIRAPECDEAGPAIARMTDPLWWRRALRIAQARALEAAAIELGYVHRRAEPYASDATVERRSQQRRRNAESMAETVAKNMDTGQEFRLADLAARSVANPRIRRGELMVRISGFEAVARGLGHVAEFWTATCPSRMHRWRKAGNGVKENQKYDGTTPREAQAYLSRCWARFRSAVHRRGWPVYGFRFAEPHHDGTPHWHLLIFSPVEVSPGRSAVGRLRALFRRYFLADSATERGAKANRCEFVAIDWARGSAAGYVAKYVAKNVDGGGCEVQGDFEVGQDSVVPAQRVEAWASTWGIRQFQQVGGPPVGVWRELRRLPEGGEYSDVVEAARSAADCGTIKGGDPDGKQGNWRRYVEVMGGPVLARKYRPVSVARTRPGERWSYADQAPYPAGLTRYGEQAAPAVYGVRDVLADRAWPSERYRWELRRGNSRQGSSESVEMGRVARGGAFGFELGPWVSAPRSPVNNCTRFTPPKETEAERETRESWEGWMNDRIHESGGADNGQDTRGVVGLRVDIAIVGESGNRGPGEACRGYGARNGPAQ